jgi:hypothetical protein
VSVWDVHNTFDELMINISVLNVNDPPEIQMFEARDAINVDEMTFHLFEDVLFTAPLVVMDIDSDALDISDSEDILTIVPDAEDPHRAVVTFTPHQADVGTIETSLTVYDGDGGLDVLDLVLVINGTNDLPGTPTVAQLGGEASLTILLQATSVTDPDGDDVTYVWDFGDHSAVRSGVDLVQVEHRYPRSGTYILTLTVDDGNGGTRSTQYEVIVPEVDDKPEETEVEQGPVALIALLIIVFTVMAVLFTYLYWTMPRRRNG